MQRHYCVEERCWLDFEEVCSWCGMTEEGARQLHGMLNNGENDESNKTTVHDNSVVAKRVRFNA